MQQWENLAVEYREFADWVELEGGSKGGQACYYEGKWHPMSEFF